MKILQEKIFRMLLIMVACFVVLPGMAQKKKGDKVLKVKVYVLSKGKKEPVDGIWVTDLKLGKVYEDSTNVDGYLEIKMLRRKTKLKFQDKGETFEGKTEYAYEADTVDVPENEENLEVVLKMTKLGKKDSDLGYGNVDRGKTVRRISFVPTALKNLPNGGKGYTIYWQCPKEEFKKNMRAVIQTWFEYPDATGKMQRTFVHPISVEAEEFYKTQNRQYAFDKGNLEFGDSLNIYLNANKGQVLRLSDCEVFDDHGVPTYRISVGDTVYLGPNVAARQYRWLFYEDYNQIFWGEKNLVSKGTSDPLHWFDFANQGMLMPERFVYKQRAEPLNDSGRANLNFAQGSSELMLDDSATVASLNAIKERIRGIEAAGGKLLSVNLRATSSPEGGYERNLKLSKERMQTAFRKLREITPTRFESETQTTVAPWDSVAALMRRDSLLAEATEIEEIVKAHPGNMDAQWARIKQKPFYQEKVIRYFPQLRRVDYELEFYMDRIRSYEEIKRIYMNEEERQTSMTLPYYYTLYLHETDEDLRYQILQDAVKAYYTKDPDHVMKAANDLLAEQIKRGKSKSSLVKKYIGTPKHKQDKEGYAAITANYAIALVKEQKADSAERIIAEFLPFNDETRMVHVVIAALNDRKYGYFKNGWYRTPEEAENDPACVKVEYMQYIKDAGLKNEVAYLLFQDDEKANKEALEKAMQLDTLAAAHFYLKAICYARNGSIARATSAYNKAIKMDPSLKPYSLGDADVYDLLPEEDKAKDNTKYGWEENDPSKAKPVKVPNKEIKKMMKEIEEKHQQK